MTGFADRFTPGQRAALAALGYTLLERVAVHGGPEPSDHRAPGAGDDRPAANGAGTGPAPAPRTDPGAPRQPLPAEVLVEDMDGSALARGLLAAARAAAGDARVLQGEGRLRIAVGGGGEPWRLTLAQLRRSPKQKAALWRVLRGTPP